jgi:hypothetical protein
MGDGVGDDVDRLSDGQPDRLQRVKGRRVHQSGGGLGEDLVMGASKGDAI